MKRSTLMLTLFLCLTALLPGVDLYARVNVCNVGIFHAERKADDVFMIRPWVDILSIATDSLGRHAAVNGKQQLKRLNLTDKRWEDIDFQDNNEGITAVACGQQRCTSCRILK